MCFSRNLSAICRKSEHPSFLGTLLKPCPGCAIVHYVTQQAVYAGPYCRQWHGGLPVLQITLLPSI